MRSKPRIQECRAARSRIVSQLPSWLPSLTKINSKRAVSAPSTESRRRTSSGSVSRLLNTGTTTETELADFDSPVTRAILLMELRGHGFGDAAPARADSKGAPAQQPPFPRQEQAQHPVGGRADAVGAFWMRRRESRRQPRQGPQAPEEREDFPGSKTRLSKRTQKLGSRIAQEMTRVFVPAG